MKALFSITIILLIIISCDEKSNIKIDKSLPIRVEDKNDKNDENMQDSLIQNILKYQLSRGADSDRLMDIKEYHSSNEQFKVAINYIALYLNKNGHKKTSSKSFEEKFNTIFGKDLYENFGDTIHFDLNYNQNPKCNNDSFYKYGDYYFYSEGSELSGIHILKKEQIISRFYFLPEIINYKLEFPEIAKVEEKPFEIIDQIEGKLNITRWKDIEDLDNQRKFNVQLLVNRNLYLFNDDKSKLPWLLKNDEFFMKSLVLTFGWEGDDKLLKWVIKETPLNYNREFNNAKDFGRLLYNKDCSGNLKINKRVFELMADENIDNHRRYLMDFINLYLARNLYEDDIELTFPEIAKITAYSLNFISNNLEKEQDIYNYQGLFAEKSDYDNRYDKEFKKNNFYGIPGFKEKWEEAKIEGDGIALPGEE